MVACNIVLGKVSKFIQKQRFWFFVCFILQNYKGAFLHRCNQSIVQKTISVQENSYREMGSSAGLLASYGLLWDICTFIVSITFIQSQATDFMQTYQFVPKFRKNDQTKSSLDLVQFLYLELRLHFHIFPNKVFRRK